MQRRRGTVPRIWTGIWTGVWIGALLAGCDGGKADRPEAAPATAVASGQPSERASGQGAARGLHFEALPRVEEGQVAPLSAYPGRDGSERPVRHYPSDSDVALLLVHGSGYHGRYLAPLAQRIATSGAAQVYTPDIRGHGMAPRRRGDCDYVDQLQDDLADLARHVRRTRPGSRIVVGGHSSGGGLAVRFAGSQYREELSGLLLLAPYLGYDAPTTRPDSGWARPRVPRIVGLGLLNALGIRALNDTTVITFDMPEAVRDGTETLAYSYRLNTGYAPRDYRTDLADLEAPLFALIGADDEAFLAGELEPALREAAPDAQVEVLPDISHLDLPAAHVTAARVIAWLESLDGR